MQDEKGIRRRTSQQLVLCFVDAIVAELKRAVVNGYADARTQYLVCLNRIFGRHVNGRHEPTRLVRAYRQKRNRGRSEDLANVAEMRAEPSVAREIHLSIPILDHVAAPQRAVVIE